MSAAKHTPAPLKLTTNGTLLKMGAHGPERHICQTVWPGDPQGDTDMLFILRAYSSHEALVAALEACKLVLHPQTTEYEGAEAALKLARG